MIAAKELHRNFFIRYKRRSVETSIIQMVVVPRCARTFIFFLFFSGCIRVRSFYFWEPKKYQMRDGGLFPTKFSSSYAREWPIAWTNLDD